MRRMADFILQTIDLTKDFKGFTAVRRVNLNVERGQIHALIGPNGAGKTTCFNLLTKFLSPTAGQIVFNGRDITGLKPAQVARQGIIRSFQISAVFPHMTLLENVRIGLQYKLGNSYHFWQSDKSLSRLNDRAMDLLEQVGLAAFAEGHGGFALWPQARTGNRGDARQGPELMLLDEPTSGMGHEDVDKVTALIKKVSQGRTTLMVEHNMNLVAGISDRITVLQRGAVLAEGTYDEVSKDAQVMEAYMGTAASS